MLTPSQIDDRMAELGGLFFENLKGLLDVVQISDKTRGHMTFQMVFTWERMKAVVEQAKANCSETPKS